jgi:hypothetical protein
MWKMKAAHSFEDLKTIEKRMEKAKLATTAAHEAEMRALMALEVGKTDLEGQRDEASGAFPFLARSTSLATNGSGQEGAGGPT